MTSDDAKEVRALRESNARLVKAQQLAGVGFWDWDLHTQQIIVSDGVYRICGQPGTQGLETPDLMGRVVHPDDIGRVQNAIAETMAGGNKFDLDVRVTRPDGEIRWVNAAAELVRDDQRNPITLLGTLTDITSRKHAETVLRASEERLRLLDDLGEAMQHVLEPDQIMPLAMRALGLHLGVSRCAFAHVDADGDGFTIPSDYTRGCDSIAGHYSLSLFGSRAVAELRRGETLVVRNVDSELSANDGADTFNAIQIKALICCSLVRNGVFRAMMAVHQTAPRDWKDNEVAIVQEVVERCWSTIEQRAALAKLRESEALLTIASRTAHIGAWTLELPDFRVTWSDEVCAIHDMPVGTVPSMEQAMAFYPPETRAMMDQKVQDCARDGTPFDIEMPLVTSTGRPIWVRSIGQAERNAASPITRIYGAFQDITSRRKLEEQLRQAQKMEAVGRLAGGVAHDFNNVLSVILSYSELILVDLKSGDPIREDVDEICKAGRRAADLTRQLLMFSRQQVIEPKVLDLNDVLSTMDKMLQRILGEDVDLVTLSKESLGRVRLDPSSIEQVILNLVVNARDAMPTGGKLTIETSNVDLDEDYAREHAGVEAGPHVMLTVSDTGIGMDKLTRTRIFEPFFTTKAIDKGTGLGLSTVYGIVHQSGGSISVYTEPGKGSCFKVFLPRVDAALDVGVAETLMNVDGTETILLVEDEDQVRGVASNILRRRGYHVVEARLPDEALLICERQTGPIHLLLTDVVMPQMSGPELAKRLTTIRPAMKVLCMSGYTDDSIVRHGVLQAEVAYLQKPITPQTLSRKVREVLDAPGPRAA